MLETLLGVLAFAAKAAIVVVGVSIVFGILFSQLRSLRPGPRGLWTEELNERLDDQRDALREALLSKKEAKALRKARRKERAARKAPSRTVYVLDFEGDLAASAVGGLRELVTALLGIATSDDEVVLRLESPGGLVPPYGLAASQLARLTAREIPLTVCVDRIAASGGYLMACEANRIVAAPFAVIGSIGVVAPVPNLHRLLGRHGVDYEEVTAGKFKRTVSLLAEISDEGRQKFREQIEETHALFKEAVSRNRPDLDIEAVSTGEYWFGTQALELHLVDELQTSDDYLLSKVEGARVLHIGHDERRRLQDRLGIGLARVVDRVLLRWLSHAWAARYG